MPPLGRPNQLVDRSWLIGVLISVAAHAFVFVVLCSFPVQQVHDPRGPADFAASSAISIVLVSGAQADPESRSIPQLPHPSLMPMPPAPSAAADGVAGVAGAELPKESATAALSGGGDAASRESPSPAPQAGAADPAIGDDYRRRLLQHIATYRRRPPLTAGPPAYGTVMVRFSLSREGEVSAVSVATSSGVADLDDEALATIWRARPMPVIPLALPDHLSVTLPVTFSATFAQAPG